MSKVYAKARVNVRSTKLEDCGSAVVVIGTTENVVGSDIDPPDEKGSTTVEHDPGIECCMVAFAANESSHVKMMDAQNALLGKPSETAYTDLGDCVILQESATRKNADSKGGEVVERRLKLRIRCDRNKPINAQTLGFLLDHKVGGVVLGIGVKQHELPIPAPVKRKPGRPKKDEQTDLDLDGKSEQPEVAVEPTEAEPESAPVPEAITTNDGGDNALEDATLEIIKGSGDGLRMGRLATLLKERGFDVSVGEVVNIVKGTDRIDCAKPTITTLLTPSMVKEG